MDVLDPSSTAPRRFFVAVAEELRSELLSIRSTRA